MKCSLTSAPKALAAALALAVVAGCGPDDGLKELAQARSAVQAGDWRSAMKLLDESLAANPRNVDALVELAVVEQELGEIAAARATVERAASLAPGDSDVILLGAQIAFHARDFEAARRGFAAIANDTALDGQLRASAWAGLGVVEMAGEQDARDAARVAFLRALRLDFKNAAAHYHLGFLYRDGFGFNEAALSELSIYVRLASAADRRVQKVQRTHIPELKETIARAAAERPGAARRDSAASAKALARAEAAVKAGKNDTARDEYAAALKADPLSFPAALGLAKCWAKSAPSKKKGAPNPQAEALEAYRTACQLNPNSVATLLAAGDLAARLGQHATAVRIYSQAMAANPSKLDAIDGLIRALRKAGRANVAAVYQGYRDSLKHP